MTPADTDLELVRQDYRASLATLTFNSKPIITSLTIIAQENIAAARQIVQAIEEHLRTVHPNKKLCTVYLLDSICKNVAGIYIPLFSRNLVHTFLDAYALVDEATQRNLERVLATWRMGPSGGPVFDLSIVSAIENGVAKRRNARQALSASASQRPYQQLHQSSYSMQQPSQLSGTPAYTNTSDPYKSYQSYTSQIPLQSTTATSSGYSSSSYSSVDAGSVLSEIQALLGLTQHRAAQGDVLAEGRVGVLRQLQTVVQSQSLPLVQLLQVKQHLSSLWTQAGMTPPRSHTPPPPPSGPSPLSHPLIPSGYSTTAFSQQQQQHLTSEPHHHTSIPIPSSSFSSSSGYLSNALSSSSILPVPSPSTIQPSDLVKNLMSFGLLGAPSSSSSSAGLVGNLGRVVVPGSVATAAAYGEMNVKTVKDLVPPLDLTSESIQIPREGAVHLLYDALPLQCKQCGFRYAKTTEGQKKMDEHLDWHFRQNRRAKEKGNKAQSRGWFVGEEDWIHSREGETANVQTAPFFEGGDHANGGTHVSADEMAAKAEEAALRQTILVQPEAEAAGRPCPICKEVFENFYNDAEEEWYLKNAVSVDGKVYHATCHADASKIAQAPSPTIPSVNEGIVDAVDEGEIVKDETVDDGSVKEEIIKREDPSDGFVGVEDTLFPKKRKDLSETEDSEAKRRMLVGLI